MQWVDERHCIRRLPVERREGVLLASVSCIITSYNNARWLTAAIESVLGQSHAIEEIIVADDASTDGSRDIIAAFAGREARIRPILRERNLGVAANRDLAVREAAGELITTLDGDDIFLPGKIAAELAVLRDSAADTIAYSNFIRRDEQNGQEREEIPAIHGLSAANEILLRVLTRWPRPRDMLYAKALFLCAGGFRHHQELYEDWDLKLRLARTASGWRHSGVAGLMHRHDGTGLSTRDPLEHLRWTMDVLFHNRDWLEPAVGSKTYCDVLNERFRSLVLGYLGTKKGP
jgi:glycosyltransferase involved in cell wall biosynthesis